MKIDTLLLKCHRDILPLFRQELQKGVYITSSEGKTVHSFLTENCGISDRYISEKIKTVFIDGGPVDDIYNTIIKEGGVCALSGAMPGIVGAMMRIGSPYASMRESITVKPAAITDSGKEIIYGMKLFNTILIDLALHFLKRGILVEDKRIYELFSRHREKLDVNVKELFLNGSAMENKKIFTYSNFSEYIKLQIDIENEDNS